MNECIFCQIVRGQRSASSVYSDEEVLAFMDIRPVNPGHTLVIPRVHASSLAELDENTGGQMFKVAMRVAAAIRKSGLKCEGVNLLVSDGEAAFQEIFHVHLHVIPRFQGDGFGFRFGSQYDVKPDRQDLDRVAEKIRGAID